MATAAPPLRSLIDVDHPGFGMPTDMPERIQACCKRTGQPVPAGKGEIVRCVLDSLALKYRLVLDEMENILGRRLDPLHIVGGGVRNRLLCQLAADATGRTVEAGPVEATAVGSVVMQAMALGRVGSLSEARDLVRRSFEVEVFEPRSNPALDDALARLRGLIQ
jgi:rhamnulokinase